MKANIPGRPCSVCVHNETIVTGHNVIDGIGCNRTGPCLYRTCSDCGKPLVYHEWLELRCTLDNEDLTRAYCLPCFVGRMKKWLVAVKSALPYSVVGCNQARPMGGADV